MQYKIKIWVFKTKIVQNKWSTTKSPNINYLKLPGLPVLLHNNTTPYIQR